MVRDEVSLIKELLPIWNQYADGFVFLLDRCTDNTLDYLNQVKREYNILEIIEHTPTNEHLIVETDLRQLLFDTAKKYSNKIICLDADEYLDGIMSKKELNELLNDNDDTLFHLDWLQYTSINTIRVDGPWKTNIKDRIGNYINNFKFEKKWNHSTHLPIPTNQKVIDSNKLHIVHLQWLNKRYSAIKQYYWKVYDYVNNAVHKVSTVGNNAYDDSVNNFDWQEEYTYDLLKISPHLFENLSVNDNYRIRYIREQTDKFNIPNLGDWGYDILNKNEEYNQIPNPYKISVITAVGSLDIYEKFILRYVKNVLEQHFFKQTEHIIVYSEWSKYFDNLKIFDNFKFIKENEKLGVYNAWNIGIKSATTDYVTNWNIDDIRHPINTKIKYDLLTQNHYDVAYNYYIATTNDEETFENIDLNKKQYLKYPDNYQYHAMQGCFLGPDPVWKKSLHDKVGYFDYENFNTIGDWEMWVRFAINGAKFKLIPSPLCLYLDHNETVSKRQFDKLELEKFKLLQKYS